MTVKRTTLKDVAKEARVSVMSVSKALNNKEGVSPETRKHILSVALKLNYYPNMVAKNLRLDKTNTLGVIVSDCSEMLVAKVLRSIANGAQERGYSIITINTDGDSERERHAIELFINKCVDGILMIAPTLASEQDNDWLNSLHVPMTILMRNSRHLSIDSVINNNMQGGYDIVDNLIRRGCKSFRFLALSSSSSQVAADRLEGARLALKEHGLILDPNQIRYCPPDIEQGEAATKAWIQEEGTKFDALVCGCDVIAIGAIDALLKQGVRIPEQICVSGYDGFELSAHLRVPLTTIRQPSAEIGRKGVNILLERIQSPDLPIQHIVLNSTLVERESSMR